jgi:hypothetical protein
MVRDLVREYHPLLDGAAARLVAHEAVRAAELALYTTLRECGVRVARAQDGERGRHGADA